MKEGLQGVKLDISRVSQVETHFQQMSETEDQVIDSLASNKLAELAQVSGHSWVIQHTSSVRWENMTSLHRLR